MYRSGNPDEETVKDVLKELQENNINISQFVKYIADHCRNLNSQMKEELPHRDIGEGNGKQLSIKFFGK
jgi:hypothetical protein